MSLVTAEIAKNFQELAPLSAFARENLETFFRFGDADPRSSFGPGADNALALEAAASVFARTWDLPRESMHLVGDRSLLYHLAIAGSLGDASLTPYRQLIHSPVDRKDAIAVARSLTQSTSENFPERQKSKLLRRELGVSLDGQFQSSSLEELPSLAIIQLRNGETGIWQRSIPRLEDLGVDSSTSAIIIDATSINPRGWGADLIRGNLVSRREIAAILFDATSWSGPRGLYLLAINPRFPWRNPLPTLDTTLPRFGANYALTLMAAVALEAESKNVATEIDKANRALREALSQIDDVDIAGHESGDRLSFSFLHVPADELVRRLARDGFLVDSGSACSSSELSPSHVLEAMGILTHGNIRLRLRDENLREIKGLAGAISRHVAAIRGELL